MQPPEADMVRDNDDGQQPMPESPHRPGPSKGLGYGPSEAPGKEAADKPDGMTGKTKYDKPAKAEDDFNLDEMREKRIRGNEAPKE
jgi:hypothetical protein